MGVVRYSELVAKIKIVKFFPGMFVSDLRKFMLTKISCYTVVFSGLECVTLIFVM